MQSPLQPYPEAAHDPLLIFSIFKATSTSFEKAYDTFFDYVHEDIKAMTRVDLDFNIFRELIIEARKEDDTVFKKKFILEEILNNKTRMHADIFEAVKQRQKISTRLLIRVTDFTNKDSSGLVIKAAEAGMIEYQEDHIYIPLEKVYIFHLIEKLDQTQVNYVSFSNAPLVAINMGVF